MSLRLEMLQVARLSRRALGESADLVTAFLHSQAAPGGGFVDRARQPDLYYSVFGLEGLIALGAEIPVGPTLDFLRLQGDGENLDFIHLACLARCWANLPPDLRAGAPRDAIAARIERHRSSDGGYNAEPDSEHGTVYGCFMASATYQDLGLVQPDPLAMLECIDHLRTDDGGYANQDDMPLGLTPATSAAATLLRHLHQPVPPGLADWLLARRHAEGGFFATPIAPVPDLLSTATALHALAGLHVDFGPLREPCLDFIDTLWTNRGGFYGTWSDEVLDCEYTFYALLALGHLAV